MNKTKALEIQMYEAPTWPQKLKLARKLLKSNDVRHWAVVMDYYQQSGANRRWGLPNHMESLLGVLRVKSIFVLKRPEHKAHHTIAMFLIQEASKPRDISLVLEHLLTDEADHELIKYGLWIVRHHAENIKPTDVDTYLNLARHLKDNMGNPTFCCTLCMIFLTTPHIELQQWSRAYVAQMPLITERRYFLQELMQDDEQSAQIILTRTKEEWFEQISLRDEFRRMATTALMDHETRRLQTAQWTALIGQFEDEMYYNRVSVQDWASSIAVFLEDRDSELSLAFSYPSLKALFPTASACADWMIVWLEFIMALELPTFDEWIYRVLRAHLDKPMIDSLRLQVLTAWPTQRHNLTRADDIKRIWCTIRHDNHPELVKIGLEKITWNLKTPPSSWPYFITLLQRENPSISLIAAQTLSALYHNRFAPTRQIQQTLQSIHDQTQDPQMISILRDVLRQVRDDLVDVSC